jgi:hypothetical protein
MQCISDAVIYGVYDDSGQVQPFLYYTIYRMHVGHQGFIYRVSKRAPREAGEMSLQLAVGRSLQGDRPALDRIKLSCA